MKVAKASNIAYLCFLRGLFLRGFCDATGMCAKSKHSHI
jgi:hypothetical protein